MTALFQGKICILDIDVKGVKAIKEKGMEARLVDKRPKWENRINKIYI